MINLRTRLFLASVDSSPYLYRHLWIQSPTFLRNQLPQTIKIRVKHKPIMQYIPKEKSSSGVKLWERVGHSLNISIEIMWNSTCNLTRFSPSLASFSKISLFLGSINVFSRQPQLAFFSLSILKKMTQYSCPFTHIHRLNM